MREKGEGWEGWMGIEKNPWTRYDVQVHYVL